MTPAGAQEAIDRAWEAGYFEEPAPDDGSCFSTRNFRMRQVEDLLGFSARALSDHVLLDPLLYGRDSPKLRFGGRARSAAQAQTLVCALWQRFLDEVGGTFVDWEAA